MKILLSNDDGFLAPGLRCLAQALSAIAEVTIVAPDRNRSGVSNSLTLDRPLQIMQHGEREFSVNGTPTDCVHLAITGLLKELPDMVISGINEGANLSDDVLYSGTVAAAMEGRFLGFPAIAVSLVGETMQYYQTAARVIAELIQNIGVNPLPNSSILNINIPDMPFSDIKGIKMTRLGARHLARPMLESINPRGQAVYWVGLPGEMQDAGVGTDYHAVKEGYVSVTPLQVDLTKYEEVMTLQPWADTLSDLLF